MCKELDLCGANLLIQPAAHVHLRQHERMYKYDATGTIRRCLKICPPRAAHARCTVWIGLRKKRAGTYDDGMRFRGHCTQEETAFSPPCLRWPSPKVDVVQNTNVAFTCGDRSGDPDSSSSSGVVTATTATGASGVAALTTLPVAVSCTCARIDEQCTWATTGCKRSCSKSRANKMSGQSRKTI